MSLVKKLFKLNSNGNTIQTWEIHANKNTYWTISGQVGGKMVQSKPTEVTPKANRTLAEQMTLEVESKIQSKRDRKYTDNIKDVAKMDDALPAFSAMLAKNYEEHKDKVRFRCAVQPKLDGVRCLATKDGLFSRERKKFSSCEHIRTQLEKFFDKYPDAELDGELYCHNTGVDFETVVGTIKKTNDKATAEDLFLQRTHISYHIYDAKTIASLSETNTFEDRWWTMGAAISPMQKQMPNVKLVTTLYAENEGDIEELRKEFVKDGYEGAMVRNLDSPYIGSRSDQLLKVKVFVDEEFEIVGFEEGSGNLAGCVGRFTLQTKSKKQFGAKMVGSFDRLRYLLNHPDEFMNKMATVKFFSYTTAGVPRFPVLKSIRGLKDRSDWL